MTRLNIPLPAVVQVHNTANYKGNPRAVLVIDGEQVLFADGHVEDEKSAADCFRAALARMFVRYLQEHEPAMLSLYGGNWSTDTDREISRENYETVSLVREKGY